MSNTEAPEPWAAAMIEKGCTHNGRPSISALARKMGTSVETARRLVNGVGDPSPATIKEAVRVLGTQVQDWTGTAPVGEPYRAPASSAWLTERQRQALDELISAFVERGSGVNGQASTTETNRASVSEAQEEVAEVVKDTRPPKEVRPAARTGENQGAKMREQFDRINEAPDDPAPDYEGTSQDEEDH